MTKLDLHDQAARSRRIVFWSKGSTAVVVVVTLIGAVAIWRRRNKP